MNICQVNLSDKEINDELLNMLLNSAPPKSILLIEDIDAAFVQRDRGQGSNGVTFSGLLNALDGVAAQEGRLLFLTTNKKDILDEALIRPGRVDFSLFFGLASIYQIEKMFEKFYPSESVEILQSFVRKIPEKTLSMATLQNYLLRYKTDPLQAIQDVEEKLLGRESDVK